MSEFPFKNNVLPDQQFGFRPGRSTEDQLLLTHDFVSHNWNNWVDLSYSSKSLDTVIAVFAACHLVLLEKLQRIGLIELLSGS